MTAFGPFATFRSVRARSAIRGEADSFCSLRIAGQLVADEAEQRAIQRMWRATADGRSLRSIAELMKAVGFFELSHFACRRTLRLP
jgi:hypothetical protein